MFREDKTLNPTSRKKSEPPPRIRENQAQYKDKPVRAWAKKEDLPEVTKEELENLLKDELDQLIKDGTIIETTKAKLRSARYEVKRRVTVVRAWAKKEDLPEVTKEELENLSKDELDKFIKDGTIIETTKAKLKSTRDAAKGKVTVRAWAKKEDLPEVTKEELENLSKDKLDQLIKDGTIIEKTKKQLYQARYYAKKKATRNLQDLIQSSHSPPRGIKRKRDEDQNGNNKKPRRTKNFGVQKNPKIDLEIPSGNFNKKKQPNKESIDLNDENLFLPEPTSVRRYYIRRTGRNGDFQQLLGRFPELSYVSQPVDMWNGKPCNQEADIYIAPIAVLGEGAYGVFNSVKIEHNPENPQFLSYYMGERTIIHPEDKSQYLFEVKLTKDEKEKMKKNGITMGPDDKFGINAEETGVNWSRFINHSKDPNTYIEEVRHITEDGKICELIIRTNQTIYQDQQLFFDYGENFFNDFSIPHIYLHRTDNWRHPHDIYLSDPSFYHQKSLWIEEDIARLLDIEESHILPTNLFVAVYENDMNKVNDIIKNITEEFHNKKSNRYKDIRDQFEFPSYCLQPKEDKHEIIPINKQQNISALMLACAKGNKDIILALINAGADFNRCTLHGGRNALVFLLLGEATPEVKLELTKELVKRGIDLSSRDAEGKTILDHAIRQENQVAKFLINHLENNNLKIKNYVTTENKNSLKKWKPTLFHTTTDHEKINKNQKKSVNDSVFPSVNKTKVRA